MPSIRPKPHPKRQMYLKLSGMIESQLREAYARRHEEGGLTQTDIANKLDVNRAAIHNRLNGKGNMTIETIANMVWALGHDIDVKIIDPEIRTTANFFISTEEEEIQETPAFVSASDEERDRFEFESLCLLMKGITATALFCEDARRESGGRFTLIGVMSDVAQVSEFPGALKRLTVHFRIRLDVKRKYPKPLVIDIEVPEGEVEVKTERRFRR